MTNELAHHGIKGQKWGFRRYQNKDGSLTDEGYRHYGYGKGGDRLISKNTSDKIKAFTKGGAKAGAGIGVAGAALAIGVGSAIAPPAVAVAAGASFLASATTTGTLYGLGFGAISGSIDTARGRRYIEKNQKALNDFLLRDLQEE